MKNISSKSRKPPGSLVHVGVKKAGECWNHHYQIKQRKSRKKPAALKELLLDFDEIYNEEETRNMPELKVKFGYFAVLVFMALVAVSMLFFLSKEEVVTASDGKK